MSAIRSWTLEGDPPMTVTVYRPAVTVRRGDGPEVLIGRSQMRTLNVRLELAADFFEDDTPELR